MRESVATIIAALSVLAPAVTLAQSSARTTEPLPAPGLTLPSNRAPEVVQNRLPSKPADRMPANLSSGASNVFTAALIRGRRDGRSVTKERCSCASSSTSTTCAPSGRRRAPADIRHERPDPPVRSGQLRPSRKYSDKLWRATGRATRGVATDIGRGESAAHARQLRAFPNRPWICYLTPAVSAWAQRPSDRKG